MNKIMKRLLPVFLCCVILFLSSCSLLPSIKTTADISFDQLSGKTIVNIAVNDKYLVIMAEEFIPDDAFDENGEENFDENGEEIFDENEEDFDEEDEDFFDEDEEDFFDKNEEENFEEMPAEEFTYYFYVWNIALNKLKSEFTLSSSVCNDFAEIALSNNNEITVLSYKDKDKSKIYDINFNEIGNANECVLDKDDRNYEKAEENPLIDTRRYSMYGNLACTSNYIDKSLNVFLNDSKNLYINKNNTDAILNCIDKKVYYYSSDEKNSIKYYYTDYENNTQSEIVLTYDGEYSPTVLALGNKYSALTLQNIENGHIDKITMINNSAMTQQSLDGIEKVSADGIDSAIQNIESSIKSDFGIDIESYKEYDENSIINDYVYNNDNLKSELLLTLYDLKHCLSTFPKEMYSELIKTAESKLFDKFKIYIIGAFADESNVNAFCKNFYFEEDSLEDELIIVYSVATFNILTFYHEFMHAFEYRIQEYVSDFDNEWMLLNPDGFEYTYGDRDLNPYYDHEEFQSYFASDYGTTNSLEDRATVFERICISAFHKDDDPYWAWADNKNLFEKAKLLYKRLKESFPSLSDEKFYVWEEYKDILK